MRSLIATAVVGLATVASAQTGSGTGCTGKGQAECTSSMYMPYCDWVNQQCQPKSGGGGGCGGLTQLQCTSSQYMPYCMWSNNQCGPKSGTGGGSGTNTGCTGKGQAECTSSMYMPYCDWVNQQCQAKTTTGSGGGGGCGQQTQANCIIEPYLTQCEWVNNQCQAKSGGGGGTTGCGQQTQANCIIEPYLTQCEWVNNQCQAKTTTGSGGGGGITGCGQQTQANCIIEPYLTQCEWVNNQCQAKSGGGGGTTGCGQQTQANCIVEPYLTYCEWVNNQCQAKTTTGSGGGGGTTTGCASLTQANCIIEPYLTQCHWDGQQCAPKSGTAPAPHTGSGTGTTTTSGGGATSVCGGYLDMSACTNYPNNYFCMWNSIGKCVALPPSTYAPVGSGANAVTCAGNTEAICISAALMPYCTWVGTDCAPKYAPGSGGGTGTASGGGPVQPVSVCGPLDQAQCTSSTWSTYCAWAADKAICKDKYQQAAYTAPPSVASYGAKCYGMPKVHCTSDAYPDYNVYTCMWTKDHGCVAQCYYQGEGNCTGKFKDSCEWYPGSYAYCDSKNMGGNMYPGGTGSMPSTYTYCYELSQGGCANRTDCVWNATDLFCDQSASSWTPQCGGLATTTEYFAGYGSGSDGHHTGSKDGHHTGSMDGTGGTTTTTGGTTTTTSTTGGTTTTTTTGGTTTTTTTGGTTTSTTGGTTTTTGTTGGTTTTTGGTTTSTGTTGGTTTTTGGTTTTTTGTGSAAATVRRQATNDHSDDHDDHVKKSQGNTACRGANQSSCMSYDYPFRYSYCMWTGNANGCVPACRYQDKTNCTTRFHGQCDFVEKACAMKLQAHGAASGSAGAYVGGSGGSSAAAYIPTDYSALCGNAATKAACEGFSAPNYHGYYCDWDGSTCKRNCLFRQTEAQCTGTCKWEHDPCGSSYCIAGQLGGATIGGGGGGSAASYETVASACATLGSYKCMITYGQFCSWTGTACTAKATQTPAPMSDYCKHLTTASACTTKPWDKNCLWVANRCVAKQAPKVNAPVATTASGAPVPTTVSGAPVATFSAAGSVASTISDGNTGNSASVFGSGGGGGGNSGTAAMSATLAAFVALLLTVALN